MLRTCSITGMLSSSNHIIFNLQFCTTLFCYIRQNSPRTTYSALAEFSPQTHVSLIYQAPSVKYNSLQFEDVAVFNVQKELST
jgi:hypothetical protein